MPSSASLTRIGLIEDDPVQSAEMIRGLAPLLPATQFMMWTAYAGPERLFETLAAGVTGYLIKQTAPTRLLDAVQELRAGGSPMSAGIARQVVRQLRPVIPHLGGTVGATPTLNACEAEILDWLAAGQSHDEVSIYRKLQAHHRAEAARLPAVEA